MPTYFMRFSFVMVWCKTSIKMNKAVLDGHVFKIVSDVPKKRV